ncbi:putative phage tail protein [Anaerosinus massiliensis]|uniref:putative phage tail protein n=1 Tax=Massilibacillus massiliensis TaxID=1806837 RepID=UPI000DA622EF|nr:putative phage tail protein [Massilibacillus massiliensis]
MQLKKYLPYYYDGVKEMDSLTDSEQPEFDSLNSELQLAFSRQSVVNADEVGIKLYEDILQIHANPVNETLDFRKQRVTMRLNASPPFTIQYLRNSLDKIMGHENYETWCDYNNFELFIQGLTTNKNWFIELDYLLAKIKPANLLFIYIAYDPSFINVGQNIYAGQGKWNYKLGEWRLGELPFYSDKVAIEWNYKLGEWSLGELPFGYDRAELIATGGIKESLLNASAEHAKTLVESIKINDILVINKAEFTLFYALDNIVHIEAVLPTTDITEITNIKICGLDNVVYSNKDMYVKKEEALRIVIEWKYRSDESAV